MPLCCVLCHGVQSTDPSKLPTPPVYRSAILYWIVGLNPSASAFFVFCCIVICEGLAAQGLGVAISAGKRGRPGYG